MEGLSKIEFKELLSLTTKESYFIFNSQLYKQVDEVTMDSPLGPTLDNAFLVHFEKNTFQSCPYDFKPHYYWRYVDDIFVLFTTPKHLEAFTNFLNGRHANMSFTIEYEKQNRMAVLDIAIICEDKTFNNSVYQPLVEFIDILTVFYHLQISLVLFTHSLIDACKFALAGLNDTMN